MVDKMVKRRKVSISEDNMSTLLRRYTATTVLALLCEVAHCSDVNIDWEALAKNTSTGISDAREYQMLWRHLAYHHALLDKFEDGAHPLDDDSDLECEVEAVPVVSTDALTEAAACVKVLITSALPSDSSLPNSSLVEAPLTINIPNGPSSRAPSEIPEATCSMQGMNITIPFSVQKQPLSAATPAEGLDVNGSANGTLPPRRKRKPWSETEDMELISAVQKFGEGNWANIVRADFMVDRTASQLSQRWAIIRKRRENLNVGINSTSSQLSEARRAAHHVISLALDMPVKNFTAARPAGTNMTSYSVLPTATAEAAEVGSIIQAKDKSHQGSVPTKTSPMGSLGPTEKSQVSSKKPSASTIGSDSVLRATAVAAGARIASPSDVASFIKATQTKNAVHIKPASGYSTKPSMPGGVSTLSETQTNLLHVCPGPEATHPGSAKAASPPIQRTLSATSLNRSSGQINAVISTLPPEHLPKLEVKAVDEIEIKDGACVSRNAQTERIQENKESSPDLKPELEKQMTDVDNSRSSLNMKTAESYHQAVGDNQAEVRQSTDATELRTSPVRGDIQSALKENCENQGTDEKLADLPSIVADRFDEKLVVLRKNEGGNEIEEENKVK
ncbi:uncharacterized protein LOC122295068 isoform X1 [Carya illinoinensis]|uniref:uncharacterized protein LOC122295068 isoform X1 n=1 Tax=Carya illinoinensis TaxID=32201 RepID=UPI001C717E00|nr:uncharacterized protein LOC122295068 isoform X1 [Carya illinoinensis]